jgi:hypothetical protein
MVHWLYHVVNLFLCKLVSPYSYTSNAVTLWLHQINVAVYISFYFNIIKPVYIQMYLRHATLPSTIFVNYTLIEQAT